METKDFVEVQILPSGIVRVYANGGMAYEVIGRYVTVVTKVDPKIAQPSGKVG